MHEDLLPERKGSAPPVVPMLEPSSEALLEPTRAEIAEIHRLCRQLRRTRLLAELSPVRFERTPYEEEVVFHLLKTLEDTSERRWKERTLAAWTLGRAQLTPEQRAEAVRILQQVVNDKQKQGRVRVLRSLISPTSWALGLSSVLTLLIWSYTQMELAWTVFLCIMFSAALIPLLFPFALAHAADKVNRVRAAAVMALGRQRVPESAGALAGAVLDPNIHRSAERPLHIVLPLLTARHYGALDAEAVPNFCRLLRYEESRLGPKTLGREKLVLELLDALEKVGDGRAVPYIQHLAAQGRTPRVLEGAQRILPILLERQKLEKEHGMLLRGASRPDALPAELLRPAAESQSTPPEQLLRATVRNEADGGASYDILS